MTTLFVKRSPRFIARMAGFLYLLVVPLGIFGTLYVPSKLIVSGDAAATANNIIASESLFRLGIVSNLLASIVMLLVVLALYQLLKNVSKDGALVMVMFVLVAVPLSMLGALKQFAALLFLSNAEFLKVFTTDQLHAMTLLSLRLHSEAIAMIFWGFWLFPLGLLVFKSGFLPKILGVLLIIASLGYVTNSFALFMGLRLGLDLFAALGEASFILWLVIKGVNIEQWEKRLLESD